MTLHVGILTAGGDSPGLNTAIRGLGKALLSQGDAEILGFRDGFRGLMENRTVRLNESMLSGILTRGGTILGTSRDKPHKMSVGKQVLDMTDAMVDNYHQQGLDVLVCIGGGGTHKSAFRLHEKGLNIITLPKTIDNDLFGTETTFGFDTALSIATEAVDRLHSTAHSHHRIIVLEVMGNNAGWLALGAGTAGGADVILIPEIAYDIGVVSEAIRRRRVAGKNFSIVCVAEGARNTHDTKKMAAAVAAKEASQTKEEKRAAKDAIAGVYREHHGNAARLAVELEQLTGLESRLTILGHVQRGGAPTAADRMLATRLGTACSHHIRAGHRGIMLASRGQQAVPVPLEEVVGRRKVVPRDHPWIRCARDVGTCLGDEP